MRIRDEKRRGKEIKKRGGGERERKIRIKRMREKLNNDTAKTTTMTLIVNYKSFDEKDSILRDTGVINTINHE